MKNLPIGIQSFAKLREMNCVYVDKTRLIHQLATTGAFYFLSRPRRFGKSLLVSTMKELYAGNKALFEGLWIENNWDWSKKNPVLHFSFDAMAYQQVGLKKAIENELNHIAKSLSLTIEAESYKEKFKELIEKVSEKYGKVVLLVDEYDKPILDYLETSTMSSAKENRDILREFYGVLKNADEHLELVFITGISKFSKVSIFSHLNNLQDITLSPKYAVLTGYTQEEIEQYFEDYLQLIQERLQTTRKILLDTMRVWYNGYSWDGINRVYNPFGTLNFFSSQQFQNFWFATGSPRFLIDQMKRLEVFNVENIIVNNATLDKFDLDNIELIPLLFQTGYLTVKELDVWTGDMVLDYPNKEVRETMYQFLIDEIARNPHRTHTGMTIKDLSKAFNANDLENVREIINSLLADLPAETFQKQTEGLYHGLVHLVFSYLGVMIQSEVHSSKGRADSIVQTANEIYIFEFKFNKTAQEAIEQINKKGYASKYTTSGKKIRGIGVNFNSATRQIDDWVEVDLS
jgi:Predicted AAA-ATPase/PD-(D/E)XK nuclease superfamily